MTTVFRSFIGSLLALAVYNNREVLFEKLHTLSGKLTSPRTEPTKQ